MLMASDVHNLSNKRSPSHKYLFNSDSFANLISPEGEINNIFFNNLISEWQKNEQTNKYINLSDAKNPKIKIDKLIADDQFASGTIKNINTQILIENREQRYGFSHELPQMYHEFPLIFRVGRGYTPFIGWGSHRQGFTPPAYIAATPNGVPTHRHKVP